MITKHFFTSRVKFLFFLIITLFTSIYSFGQYSNVSILPTNSQAISVGTQLEVKDLELNATNHWDMPNSRKTTISLKTNGEIAVIAGSQTNMKIKITPILSDGSYDATSQLVNLTTDYNPYANAANFSDLSVFQILNSNGAKIEILSFSTKNLVTGTVTAGYINPNITLEAKFEADRSYTLSQQATNITTQIVDESGVPVALNFIWDPVVGAKEYELEWTWVDNFGSNSISLNSTLGADEILFSSRDFELNNTRIRTDKLTYEIPLIYSRGYIIYRVRAVGRFTNDITTNAILYGPWSGASNAKTTVADWIGSSVLIDNHDANKNWQFQASFAEQGKKKEVVSYFDGSLRNRQTVTKTNTENTAVVGEVIYDAQGRAAIEVLPVPLINNNYIRYFKDLNKNANETVYTHRDFDWNPAANPPANSCTTTLNGMSNLSGASKYYSSNNQALATNPFAKYIPDAQEFPFSQVEYTPDNTGRIARKGGVGLAYQLDKKDSQGKTHEMKYFYTTPEQIELNRLFGYSVGDASHYKKNIVVDPNGQISVSYIDPKGHTIATGLTGAAPSAMVPLVSDQASIKADLLNKLSVDAYDTPEDKNILGTTNNFSSYNDKLEVYKSVGVTGMAVAYDFKYTLNNETFFTPPINNFLPTGCSLDNYSFVYDLDISLKDKCNTTLMSNSTRTIGTQNYGSNPPKLINPTITLQNPNPLNSGNYSLTKTLSVNKEALEKYANRYIAQVTDTINTSCRIDPSRFAPHTLTEIDCHTTCEEFKAKIAGPNYVTEYNYKFYVLREIKKFYGFEDTSTIVSYNSNTIVLLSNAVNSENEPITLSALGNPITLIEVQALEQKYIGEWNLLDKLAEQTLCGKEIYFGASTCEINRSTLLTDLCPSGQYAKITIENPATLDAGQVTDNVLSIFNENNTLYYYDDGTTIGHNWKHPIGDGYKNADGTLSKITLTRTENNNVVTYEPEPCDTCQVDSSQTAQDGSIIYTVRPEQLKYAKDFKANWSNSWAEALLPYHPEYQYMLYSGKICLLTKELYPVKISKTTDATPIITYQNQTETKIFTSDDYDNYLDYLDATAAGTEYANIFDWNAPLKIMNNDPYFTQQLGATENPVFENSNTFDARRAIMIEALNSHYESFSNATMLQAAYQMTMGNSVTAFNGVYDWNSLNDPQNIDLKNTLWTTYKSLYKSFKNKVKHVFLNIYAYNQGVYNGCIGTPSQGSLTSVISGYTTTSSIQGLISQNITTSLCSSGVNYTNSAKRFIPVDAIYDSSISAADAITALTPNSNYQYYAQTGKCPMVQDLEVFLKGYFSKFSNDTGFQPRNIGQYVSSKLFHTLNGTNQSVTILPSTQLETLISLDSKTITFFSNLTGCSEKIKLSLPVTQNFTWNYYSTTPQPNSGNWNIVSFSDLVFNNSLSSLENGNRIFAYNIIAKIFNGTVVKEVVLSGTTCLPIGRCDVTNNNIGEVLDPNSASVNDTNGCNKKAKFEQAFVNFFNSVRNMGNQSIALSSIPTYSQTYLAEFFNESSNITSTWQLNSVTNVYELKRGDTVLFSMNNNFTGTVPLVQSIKINTAVTPNTITFKYTNGSTTCNLNTTLNFDCCRVETENPCPYDIDCDGVPDETDNCLNNANPLQEDIDNDGIGDACDNYTPILACEGNGDEEVEFETKLKDAINSIISNSNNLFSSSLIPTANIGAVQSFVNDCELESRLQFIKDSFYNPLTPNTPPFDSTPVRCDMFRAGRSNYFWITFQYTSNINFYSTISLGGGSDFDFDFNLVNTITKIDFINYNDLVRVHYIGFDGIEDSKICYLNIQTVAYYMVFEDGDQATAQTGRTFCDFLNRTWLVGNKSKTNFMKNNENNSSTQNRFPETSIAAPTECMPCIPPTVTPVSCTDKYASYLSHFNFVENTFQENGDGANITLTTSTVVQGMEQYTEEEYCRLKLAYIEDSYHYYINKFSVNITTHPKYLSMLQFGNTNLHYGFSGIFSVIDEYYAYCNNAAITEKLGWSSWVNTVYMASHSVCPPVAMQVESPFITPPPGPQENPCEKITHNLNALYAQEAYNAYIASLREDFIKDYIKKAMENVVENFTMEFNDNEYQYTLYYYDQAGNLTQTVAPEGVNKLALTSATSKAIDIYRKDTDPLHPAADDTTLQPNNSFKTQYKYNTLNQLVWQSTPDGGVTKFAYDKLGRIIASQNENQLAAASATPVTQKFSYTEYDSLGRIVQAGEISLDGNHFSINDEGQLVIDQFQVESATQPTDGTVAYDTFNNYPVDGFVNYPATKNEVTTTIYSDDPIVESPNIKASSFFTTNPSNNFDVAHNNRNRVTGIFYYEQYNSTTPLAFNNAIFYNYDVHGNVKEQVTYNSFLKGIPCNNTLVVNSLTGQLNDCEKHLKRVVYSYDLISGNVNTVTFQKGKADQFIHKYNYDADNRIVNVETSPDGVIWEKDADYKYYPHGPLARVELGNKKVQGVDYAYTLQGWLKVVNGENIASANNDLGNDGNLAGTTKTKDAFGYSLSYYDDATVDNATVGSDYKAIQNDAGDNSFKPLMFSRDTTIPPGNINNLYNGNIKQMTTAIRKSNTELLPVQRNNYQYDQLNRISSMTSNAITPTETGHNGTPQPSYQSSYTYDKNGNLKTLNRTAPKIGMAPPIMDELHYEYQAKNNKLKIVRDSAPVLNSSYFDDDLEDQVKELNSLGIVYDSLSTATSKHNYVYDKIGQLIEDRTEKLKIHWRVDGKVKYIEKKLTGNTTKIIAFEYDGLGNRIGKKTYLQNDPTNVFKTTYYSRDAQGNVLGVYDLNQEATGGSLSLKLKEHHLYGSSRLGVEDKDLLVYNIPVNNVNYNARKQNVKGTKTDKNAIALQDNEVNATLALSSQNRQQQNEQATTQNNVALPLSPFTTSFTQGISPNPTTTATWTETPNVSSNNINDDLNIDTTFRLNTNPDGDITIGNVNCQYNENVVLKNTYVSNFVGNILTYNTGFTLIQNQACTGIDPSSSFGYERLISNNTNPSIYLGDDNINNSPDLGLSTNGKVEIHLPMLINNLMFGIQYYGFTDNNQDGMNFNMKLEYTSPNSYGKIKFYRGINPIAGSPTDITYVAGDFLQIKRENEDIIFMKNNENMFSIAEQQANTPTNGLNLPMKINFYSPANSTARIENPKVYNYNVPTSEISTPVNSVSPSSPWSGPYNRNYANANAYQIYANNLTDSNGVFSNTVSTTAAVGITKTVLSGDGYIERELYGNNDDVNTYFGLHATLNINSNGTIQNDNISYCFRITSLDTFTFGRLTISNNIITFTPLANYSMQCLKFASNEKLRIEKRGNLLLYEKVAIDGTITILGRAGDITMLGVTLFPKIYIPAGQTSKIKGFRVVNYNNTPSVKRKQATLVVTKTATNYIPRLNITTDKLDYTSTAAIIPTRREVISYTLPTSAAINYGTMGMEGMKLSFDLKYDTNSAKFNINGVETNANQPTYTFETNPSQQLPASSQIGGLANFEMCSFNYRFGTTTNSNISNQINFGLPPNVPILGSSAAQVSVNLSNNPSTAPIVKNLNSLCSQLLDQDDDGIYDIYEVVYNSNSTITYTDTDSDGLHDYLDNDDDGDGIATWETSEGGLGVNNPNPGPAYTLDSNNNGIPNYLEFSDIVSTNLFTFKRYLNLIGDKRYELANHLGNVLVVINDKKIPTFESNALSYFNADIISYSDYYPFGMLVPTRHGSSGEGYRYGFQGQEKDNEIKGGDGNSLNYTFRMHDPRVGRFFAVDPLEKSYPWNSPYAFSENRVIDSKELEGGEKIECISVSNGKMENVIKTIDGLDVMKQLVTETSEKTGDIFINKAYSKALNQLADGFMTGSNGKIYQTSIVTEKTIYLIDGKKIENVTLGKNFGYKGINGEVITTKGINQVEALASKSNFSIIGELFHIMPLLSTLFDITKGTVSQDDPKGVDALSLSPVGFVSQEQYDASNNALGHQFLTEFDKAKAGGLESVKSFINIYNQNYTKHFEVLMIDDTAVDKIIKNEYVDYIEVFDASHNSKSEPKNGILIEFYEDKAIIHSIYLDTSETKTK